jgi:hypothetical protein
VDLPQLQPLSFGELLDRVFTYYRRNFRLFVGIMAIPQAIVVAGTTVLQAFQPRPANIAVVRGAAPPNPFANLHPTYFLGLFVLMAVYFILYSIAMGATTFAVSEVHLGRTITVREAYQRLRGRIGRIFLLTFALGFRWFIAMSLGIAGFALVFGLSAAATAAIGRVGVVLGVLTGFIGLLAMAVLMAWYFLRFGVCTPALLLENLTATQALRRSASLTKGNILRVFAVGILTWLVSTTVAATLQGPFAVAAMVMALKTHAPAPFWLSALSALSGGIGTAITAPLVMLGIVLLYYDIRVRKEGFDLQLMMAALDGQSPDLSSQPGYRLPVEPPITQTNLVTMAVLAVLTFGLYFPIWFMQKRSGLNQLHSARKASLGIPIAALVLSALVALLNFGVANRVPWINDIEIRWDTIANLLATGVIGGLLLIQSFQVRSILEDHLLTHSHGPLAGSIAMMNRSEFSPLGTFFFGIFYLQYKMNEMVETWPQNQPSLGADPVPAA